MKIVVNKCFGGFSISVECAEYMAKRGHKGAEKELAEYRKKVMYKGRKIIPRRTWYGSFYEDNFRTNPLLVEAVEALGDKANGELAQLRVVEIPDDIEYEIDEYDGVESVHEKHRSW